MFYHYVNIAADYKPWQNSLNYKVINMFSVYFMQKYNLFYLKTSE